METVATDQKSAGNEPPPLTPGSRIAELLAKALDPVMRRLSRPEIMRLLYLVPSMPAFVRARYAPPIGPWPGLGFEVPEHVRTVAGIRRDPGAEEEAFAKEPLQDWVEVHNDAVRWLYSHGWRHFVPIMPRLIRAVRAANRTHAIDPEPAAGVTDPAELTQALKARAAELGLSAVGVAKYDPKYTFQAYQEQNRDERVIVCILEQNWEATQTIPSARAEKSALLGYAEVIARAAELAGFLHEHGYRARTHDVQGENVVLHYAVEAGLGQMGLNGQVLTPFAGSRCRIITINTNAPLVVDGPVDFGIHKICDACQVCVRRCPSGAIPESRTYYRGVEKAKLNTARCFPVVAQAHGCGICMKVCPVQRYGLHAVGEEFAHTGRILGKDTDELEGYNFEGRYYGAGQRPKLRPEWFSPPGLTFDPKRKLPLVGTGKDFR